MERWRALNHRMPDSIALMIVLYQQKRISSSPVISLDSVLSLQKNTDLAALSIVTIGGRPYTLFFQPFDFLGSRVVLCGLVDKGKYDRQVKNLPTYFVAAMIRVACLDCLGKSAVRIDDFDPGPRTYRLALGPAANLTGATPRAIARCASAARQSRNVRGVEAGLRRYQPTTG